MVSPSFRTRARTPSFAGVMCSVSPCLRKCWPRNTKPSRTCVIAVFSLDSSRPRSASPDFSLVLQFTSFCKAPVNSVTRLLVPPASPATLLAPADRPTRAGQVPGLSPTSSVAATPMRPSRAASNAPLRARNAAPRRRRVVRPYTAWPRRLQRADRAERRIAACPRTAPRPARASRRLSQTSPEPYTNL